MTEWDGTKAKEDYMITLPHMYTNPFLFEKKTNL